MRKKKDIQLEIKLIREALASSRCKTTTKSLRELRGWLLALEWVLETDYRSGSDFLRKFVSGTLEE